MRHLKLIWLAPIIALWLQGCSTTKPSTQPQGADAPLASIQTQLEPAWQLQLQRLQELDYWHAEGRLAVKQGKKGGNASFIWTQKGEHYEIKLFGPFGSGAVYITGNNHQVQLKEANGKIHTAKTPEALLQTVAGWQVPISGMRYWLRGMPVPHDKLKKHRLNPDATLKSLQQDGWLVDYESYHHDNALPMPWKVQLTNRKLKVKVIVKSWKTH